jgi:hypothetical protein
VVTTVIANESYTFTEFWRLLSPSARRHRRSRRRKKEDAGFNKESLVGAWHLVRIEAPGSDGNAAQPKGMLIYTRDGHMSVQLMYANSTSTLSNEYVKDGYEASFGSYDVDEAAHTVIHHAQGSLTRDLLVGKDLPRLYQFTEDGHLIIRSSRSDEHWSVTWEHY